MNFRNFNILNFFRGNSSQNIKKEIRYKDIVIRLYNYKIEDLITSESNIKAFDVDNNLLWIAENCANGRYFEMQIDELNNQIEANNGGGSHYEIELKNGKIIRQYLIK
ncbi:hypothetical protein [Ferruginibacter sp.]|nr:hypothetical protein [Ferruginibacter sp.]